MLEKNRRGNLVWMGFMALAALLFLGSGELGALAVLGILSMGILLFAAASRSQHPQQLGHSRSQRFPATTAARSARLQASQHHDYDDHYGLQDVGLIVDEPRLDGLRLRRAKDIMLDDEAVRPYVVINAPQYGHPAQVLVRFEICDAAGQSQFVYEMDYYMRAGENAILPDYRLPLRGNPRLTRTGKWDLQVWINGGLLAVHTFNAAPSLEERRRQFGLDGEAQMRLELEPDPTPVSLEELLGQRSSRSQF
jgi:hypothetical protein